jgi:hypothetical protein
MYRLKDINVILPKTCYVPISRGTVSCIRGSFLVDGRADGLFYGVVIPLHLIRFTKPKV